MLKYDEIEEAIRQLNIFHKLASEADEGAATEHNNTETERTTPGGSVIRIPSNF